MSEEEKKTLPSEVLDEIKTAKDEHPESGKDVSEMASMLEGKIPTEKKDE